MGVVRVWPLTHTAVRLAYTNPMYVYTCETCVAHKLDTKSQWSDSLIQLVLLLPTNYNYTLYSHTTTHVYYIHVLDMYYSCAMHVQYFCYHLLLLLLHIETLSYIKISGFITEHAACACVDACVHYVCLSVCISTCNR